MLPTAAFKLKASAGRHQRPDFLPLSLWRTPKNCAPPPPPPPDSCAPGSRPSGARGLQELQELQELQALQALQEPQAPGARGELGAVSRGRRRRPFSSSLRLCPYHSFVLLRSSPARPQAANRHSPGQKAEPPLRPSVQLMAKGARKRKRG
ncbi:hypothetical protein VULLAG_LOCUS7316 [Vulpes lagopus]